MKTTWLPASLRSNHTFVPRPDEQLLQTVFLNKLYVLVGAGWFLWILWDVLVTGCWLLLTIWTSKSFNNPEWVKVNKIGECVSENGWNWVNVVETEWMWLKVNERIHGAKLMHLWPRYLCLYQSMIKKMNKASPEPERMHKFVQFQTEVPSKCCTGAHWPRPAQSTLQINNQLCNTALIFCPN